ncbi:hypothetical protein L226DRAFT_320464 [Lentinus tigrinus ALCF2SS1-7]|uniref:uncharacterized protein n=1 Tax=Lentinus tigrinus ALCF2SS1-7 TaxID=1328758 RepID=UPI001166120E|nr:hypothetical protein L226DRAFT_320464 [Lentinus tigrinus ALCF2SS1-7]
MPTPALAPMPNLAHACACEVRMVSMGEPNSNNFEHRHDPGTPLDPNGAARNVCRPNLLHNRAGASTYHHGPTERLSVSKFDSERCHPRKRSTSGFNSLVLCSSSHWANRSCQVRRTACILSSYSILSYRRG